MKIAVFGNEQLSKWIDNNNFVNSLDEQLLEFDAILILIEDFNRNEKQYNGLDFYQHLRYHNNKDIRMLPVVLTSFLSSYAFLKNNPKLLIALSPRTAFIQLPFAKELLLTKITKIKNEDLTDSILNNFIPKLNSDKTKSTHAFKNYLGMDSFYSQLKENDVTFKIDDLEKTIGQNSEQIWYKKNLILSTFSSEPLSSTKLSDLRNLVKNKKTLLIDDLADNGWKQIISQLLYQDKDSGSLTCLKSISEINDYYSNDYINNISEIVETERYKKDLENKQTSLSTKFSSNVRALNTIEEKIADLKREIQNIENEVNQNLVVSSEKELQELIEELFEVYVDNIETRNSIIKKIIEKSKERNRLDNQKIDNNKQLKLKNKELLSFQDEIDGLELENEEIKKKKVKIKEGIKNTNIPNVNLDNFRLILLDLNLGTSKDDGLIALKSIRKYNKQVPIIVFSSNEDINTFLRLNQYNISGCFVKGKNGINKLIRLILDDNSFYYKINTVNYWDLYIRYLKIKNTEYLKGKKFHSNNKSEVITLNDNSRLVIFNLLEEIFSDSMRVENLKQNVIRLGLIQEKYVTGGNKNVNYFKNDNKALRELRNDAAHNEYAWSKRDINEKINIFFESTLKVLRTLYPF